MTTEIDRATEQITDPHLTRRLIALEMGDVDVPPRLVDGEEGEEPALFFRVVDDDGVIRIELWERGEFHGARTLSAQGTKRLLARKIALATTQLAMRLRRVRLLERKQAQEQQEEQELEPPRRLPLQARFILGTEARATLLTGGGAWAVGPGIWTQLRFDSGPVVELGLSHQAGSVEGLQQTSWRWFGGGLRLAHEVHGNESFRVTPGLGLSLAQVQFGGPSRVDGVRGSSQTWSGATTLDVSLQWSVGDSAWLTLRPEVGAALRRVRVEDPSGDVGRVGGALFGLRVGVAFDPDGRP